MKITITYENFQELIYNLLSTYRNNLELKSLNNSQNINILIYKWLINSSLISQKLSTILNLHLIEEYDNAYNMILYQSDIVSDFYERLIEILIEIEYIQFYKKFVYIFEYLNEEESFDVNKNFETDMSRNLNKQLDKYKRIFINKKTKFLKFFNINIDKVIRKIEYNDFKNFNFEIYSYINNCYKTIVEMLFVIVINLEF